MSLRDLFHELERDEIWPSGICAEDMVVKIRIGDKTYEIEKVVVAHVQDHEVEIIAKEEENVGGQESSASVSATG